MIFLAGTAVGITAAAGLASGGEDAAQVAADRAACREFDVLAGRMAPPMQSLRTGEHYSLMLEDVQAGLGLLGTVLSDTPGISVSIYAPLVDVSNAYADVQLATVDANEGGSWNAGAARRAVQEAERATDTAREACAAYLTGDEA